MLMFLLASTNIYCAAISGFSLETFKNKAFRKSYFNIKVFILNFYKQMVKNKALEDSSIYLEVTSSVNQYKYIYTI